MVTSNMDIVEFCTISFEFLVVYVYGNSINVLSILLRCLITL